MPDTLFPPDIEPFWSLVLIAVSAGTSFITAAAGIGGGIILLAVMATLVPAHAVIPVHGVVQIGSNGGRTAIMLPHVQWSVMAPFLAGTVLGAAIGGYTVVQLPAAWLKIGLAGFIVWCAWAPLPGLRGRLITVVTGAFSSFLTMFFGATGSFVSAMVKTFKFGRLEHVATHSACMVAQHIVKVIVFGILGFNFAPYAWLIVAMVMSGFAGTVIGKRFLMKTDDRKFHYILSAILTLLALRLLYEGISLL